MKSGLLILALSLSMSQLIAQSTAYLQLLKVAKDGAGLILYNKPPSPRSRLLNLKNLYDIRNPKDRLSDTLVNKLVEACARMDTSEWVNSDFSRTVVVKDRSNNINVNRTVKEWGLTDKAEIKKYRQRLREWMNTEVSLRYLNYLSRPVLTDDEEYGIILKDDVEGNLCCGGHLQLYRYEAGQWKDMGLIYSWKY
jgi:hypothetical protein